jgi:hypothetical protein
MRIRSPLSGSAVVVKCVDKTEALSTFILDWLRCEAVRVRAGSLSDTSILALARSPKSPVIGALSSAGADIASAGLSVKVAFATIADAPGLEPWIDPNSMLAFGREVRHAANPRMSEAHEQLVLGSNAVWFGDCMRRDPSQRDAYESYCPDNPALALSCTQTFTRLWQRTTPLAMRSLSRSVAPPPPALSAAHLNGEQLTPAAAIDTVAQPLASTRH